jgi:hypothetical protein
MSGVFDPIVFDSLVFDTESIPVVGKTISFNLSLTPQAQQVGGQLKLTRTTLRASVEAE